MRQVAKYACPLFVLLGLVIFHSNDSRYILPIAADLTVLSIIFFANESLRNKPNSGALLLFWLSPLALLWLLSERREGRDISPFSIIVEIALAGIATCILLAGNSLKKEDGRLILAILLTWCVGYFSGSSGGADKMHPMFGFLGLTGDQVIQLVIWIRKCIHITFYGTLGFLFATYLWPRSGKSNALLFGVLFPLGIASCDEFRQSMMPNRQGSVYDVMLDMSSVTVVLIFLWYLNNRKKTVTIK